MVGTFPKSKFPDASQEPILQAGLSKDSSLGSAMLIPFYMVSHEVAVKQLAGAPSFEALTGAGRYTYKKVHLCGYRLEVLHQVVLSTRMPECPQHTVYPTVSNPRQQENESTPQWKL